MCGAIVCLRHPFPVPATSHETSSYVPLSGSPTTYTPKLYARGALEMMLFGFFLCFEVCIFALALFSDYVWKQRTKPPSQGHRPVCHYCAQGNSSVAVSGIWIHQFQDRWISCSARNEPQSEVATLQDSATPALTEAVAWQSDDELVCAVEQR